MSSIKRESEKFHVIIVNDTVEPRSTDTLETPALYGSEFRLSRQKAHIFSQEPIMALDFL